VAYSSFNGVDPATLGDGDVVVTGPGGFTALGRFAGVEASAEAGRAVASYFVRVPAGADGEYQVMMSSRAVRDVFGRSAVGGELGEVSLTVAAGQRAAVPVLAPQAFGTAHASARRWLSPEDDVLGLPRT
jgi:hypothetical protein